MLCKQSLSLPLFTANDMHAALCSLWNQLKSHNIKKYILNVASVSAAHCKMNDEVLYLHTVNQWHHERIASVSLPKDIQVVLMIF